MSRSEWARTVESIAKQNGLAVEPTGKNHMRLKHPSGWFVFTAGTPSSVKSARRLLEQDIRRARTLGRA